jgi:hypothetical protein
MTSPLIDKAQRMYDSRRFSMAEIAQSCGVTPMTIYRNIQTEHRTVPAASLGRPPASAIREPAESDTVASSNDS